LLVFLNISKKLTKIHNPTIKEKCDFAFVTIKLRKPTYIAHALKDRFINIFYTFFELFLFLVNLGQKSKGERDLVKDAGFV
jgi:hypothetical protein